MKRTTCYCDGTGAVGFSTPTHYRPALARSAGGDPPPWPPGKVAWRGGARLLTGVLVCPRSVQKAGCGVKKSKFYEVDYSGRPRELASVRFFKVFGADRQGKGHVPVKGICPKETNVGEGDSYGQCDVPAGVATVVPVAAGFSHVLALKDSVATGTIRKTNKGRI